MFAQRVNVDVSHDYHFVVVIFGEYGIVGDGGDGLVVAFCHEEEGFGPAVGRFEQAFAVRVFAYAFEDRSAGVCHFCYFFFFGCFCGGGDFLLLLFAWAGREFLLLLLGGIFGRI